MPEEMWILASVVKYYEDEDKYEVEDEDPGDESDPNPVRKYALISKENFYFYFLLNLSNFAEYHKILNITPFLLF